MLDNYHADGAFHLAWLEPKPKNGRDDKKHSEVYTHLCSSPPLAENRKGLSEYLATASSVSVIARIASLAVVRDHMQLLLPQ